MSKLHEYQISSPIISCWMEEAGDVRGLFIWDPQGRSLASFPLAFCIIIPNILRNIISPSVWPTIYHVLPDIPFFVLKIHMDIVCWPKGNPSLTTNCLLDIGKICFSSDPSWQESAVITASCWYLALSFIACGPVRILFLGQTCHPYCVSLSRLKIIHWCVAFLKRKAAELQ